MLQAHRTADSMPVEQSGYTAFGRYSSYYDYSPDETTVQTLSKDTHRTYPASSAVEDPLWVLSSGHRRKTQNLNPPDCSHDVYPQYSYWELSQIIPPRLPCSTYLSTGSHVLRRASGTQPASLVTCHSESTAGCADKGLLFRSPVVEPQRTTVCLQDTCL